jgi:hypothetical protein
MVYNSAVLVSRLAELMTANKNCKLGLQKSLTKTAFLLRQIRPQRKIYGLMGWL